MQVVGLLGPSGGGKSTLMRSVVGVQVVAGGTVTVLGEPAGSPALRHRVGYLTQAPSVYADLTVRDNVRYFAEVVGVGPDAVDRAIESVDLTDHAGARVENLSGGQLSRASLACTLVGDPEVLVLDEPTVGLDPVLRRDLWEIFRALAAGGRTLLVSSHVMDEAARCDRLVLLRAGRILSDSTLPDLLERTGTEDAEQAFLALIDDAAADDRRAGGPGPDPGEHSRRYRGRHGDASRRAVRTGEPAHHARDRRPHPAPAARRPPHRRADDRRAVRPARPARVGLRRLARSTSSTAIGPALLGVFPLVVMFIVTSIATLRERTSGTLERLLTTPLGKGDLMLGYALAFGVMAVLQALVASAFAIWVCGLDVAGPVWLLVVIAVVDAVLGTALGLLASGFARTEFQAVQFMPAFILPQFLLCGLLMPRDQMPGVLEAVSDVLPLSYAVDAMNDVATRADPLGDALPSLGVMLLWVAGALVLGSLTLRRRTA